MKRSRINDLIKSNISIDSANIINEKNIKIAFSKDRKNNSRYGKRLKEIRNSFGNNTRNRGYNLYPYETHQRGAKKIRNTIYSDNVIVNNNFGLKIANNYLKPSRKLIQSVDSEKWNFDRKKLSLDRLNVKLK